MDEIQEQDFSQSILSINFISDDLQTLKPSLTANHFEGAVTISCNDPGADIDDLPVMHSLLNSQLYKIKYNKKNEDILVMNIGGREPEKYKIEICKYMQKICLSLDANESKVILVTSPVEMTQVYEKLKENNRKIGLFMNHQPPKDKNDVTIAIDKYLPPPELLTHAHRCYMLWGCFNLVESTDKTKLVINNSDYNIGDEKNAVAFNEYIGNVHNKIGNVTEVIAAGILAKINNLTPYQSELNPRYADASIQYALNMQANWIANLPPKFNKDDYLYLDERNQFDQFSFIKFMRNGEVPCSNTDRFHIHRLIKEVLDIQKHITINNKKEDNKKYKQVMRKLLSIRADINSNFIRKGETLINNSSTLSQEEKERMIKEITEFPITGGELSQDTKTLMIEVANDVHENIMQPAFREFFKKFDMKQIAYDKVTTMSLKLLTDQLEQKHHVDGTFYITLKNTKNIAHSPYNVYNLPSITDWSSNPHSQWTLLPQMAQFISENISSLFTASNILSNSGKKSMEKRNNAMKYNTPSSKSDTNLWRL